jgi:predicted transcriptional regulator of viral defense system
MTTTAQLILKIMARRDTVSPEGLWCDITRMTGMTIHAVRRAIQILAKQGKVVRVKRGVYRLKQRPIGHARLEHGIELRHCGQIVKLIGNLSLRGAAGATTTRLAYVCEKCFQRFQLVDEWDRPDISALDSTP